MMLAQRETVPVTYAPGVKLVIAAFLGMATVLAFAALTAHLSRPRYTFMQQSGAVFRADNETGEIVLCSQGKCVNWGPAASTGAN